MLNKSRQNKVISFITFTIMILTSILGFVTIMPLVDDNDTNFETFNNCLDTAETSQPWPVNDTPKPVTTAPTGLASAAGYTRAPRDVQYWATFQFDYSNTGNTTGSAPNSNHTLWKFNDEGNLKGQIFSTPIVVNDYVYFTTDFGYLYAVDRYSGDKKWRFDMQKNTYATPTYSNGYLYVGTGTEYESAENYLYKIDALSGQEDKNFRITIVEGAIMGAPIVLDYPGTTEDRLYFGTVKDNSVYSYNLGTAQPQPKWSFQIPGAGATGNDGVWSSIAYYAGTPKRLLFTVNSEATGMGISRGLYCLNAEDNNELWKFPMNDIGIRFQTYSSPTVFYDSIAGQGKAIFGAGVEYMDSTREGKLFCLDITTGAELWNFTTLDGDFGYGVVSSAVIAYDKIIFGSADGKVYALDFQGKLLWSFQTNDTANGVYSSPAVADGKVYVGSTDKYFYCLNVHNGSLIWEYDTADDLRIGTYGVASSPAIAYNRVFVGGCNGYLYCFGSESSEPPKITIDAPQNDDVVNGTVEIIGTAEDDIAVTYVQVRIDNGSWTNTTGTTTWSYTWDTTQVIDGPHSITARAFDDNGFTKINITVIVNNLGGEMFIQVTSHKDGQVVAGTTKFEGIAYHSGGTILEVQINIDNNTEWEVVNGTTSWYYFWDTTTFEDGAYFIQFRAFDNRSNSTPINITVKVLNYVEDPSIGIYPMFRANHNRVGITGYKVPSTINELWKFETENAIESSAIFYNNRIYFGSDDWFIYCLNSNTGLLQWKYETSNQVRSTPVIANQKLYIGSQDYYFYCLNAISGELLWRYHAGGEIDSSPLIVGDHVFFGAYDGFFYALNASSGSELWKFDAGDDIWGSPAYYEKCLYFGALNGKMYCLWVNNGTQRWNYSTNQFAERNGIYSTPVATGDQVIFGSEDEFVYCLNSSTGERLWMFKTTGYVYSSAAVGSNKVFISSLEEDNDGMLYALPFTDPDQDGILTSSEVLWKFNTKDFDGGSSPTFSITSGRILIGSNYESSGGDGRVFCLNANTGEEVWNFTTGGDVHGTPIIAINRIYIGSLDNNLYCLGVKSDGQDDSQIKIEINIPETTVMAGRVIENITFTAKTEDGEPIPQAWFNFKTTKGYLSAYFGTAFEDGTYTISYIAPEPSKVSDKINVTISVNATRFPYNIGFNSVDIIVEPRTPTSGNDSENGDTDDTDDSGDVFEELMKPKNSGIFSLIIILIILNIIVFSLFFVIRHKVNQLEHPEEAEEEHKENEEKDEEAIAEDEKEEKEEEEKATADDQSAPAAADADAKPAQVAKPAVPVSKGATPTAKQAVSRTPQAKPAAPAPESELVKTETRAKAHSIEKEAKSVPINDPTAIMTQSTGPTPKAKDPTPKAQDPTPKMQDHMPAKKTDEN